VAPTKKEEEKASSNSSKQSMHSTNTLEHTLISLENMANEHVFVKLVHHKITISALTKFEIWQNSVCLGNNITH
jgi:hypothetical protein